MKACFYAFGRCAECNITIHAHAWDESDISAAFVDAIELHMHEAHYVGEPVEIVDAMVMEAGAA